MKGIIISKEGHNTSEDTQYQYVDTRTPLFKLFTADKGTLNLAAEPSPYRFKITHNLGYFPMHFLYADGADSSLRRFVTNAASGYDDNSVTWNTFFSDKDSITVEVDSNTGTITGSFGYNYLIFYDKVGDVTS